MNKVTIENKCPLSRIDDWNGFVVSGRFDCVVSLDKFVVVLIEDILIYYKLRERTGRVFEN